MSGCPTRWIAQEPNRWLIHKGSAKIKFDRMPFGTFTSYSKHNLAQKSQVEIKCNAFIKKSS